MVYIPNLHCDKQRLLALLTADLTSAQLDRIQELFGIGATSRSPYPAEELFIEDKREWSHLSHADLMRAYPEQDPLLVIDSHTPHDGGIWYIEGFATADDVANGLAESLNTLYKIRMDIRDVVMQFTSYSVANTHISNDLWHVNVHIPIPDDFEQKTLFCSGANHIRERYSDPTWVIATPDELEDSTTLEAVGSIIPRPEIVYRVKKDIARQAGLESRWMVGSDASNECELPDGTNLAFPPGSKVVQSEYDPDVAIPVYTRPIGNTSAEIAAFRFLDLPREVRDKIYEILLCTFPQPDPTTDDPTTDDPTTDDMLSLEHFSPSILRVNKQMYSEGYNVMIKVNCFVLVTCNGYLYFSHMLKQNDVPFLPIDHGYGASSSDPATRDFRGHAIHVTIGNSKYDCEEDLPPSHFLWPCHIIMLFRDLELLCQAIMRGDDLLEDHMDVVLISIELGSAAIVPPYQTEAPTTYFSSTKVQKELLEPFRRRIRDVPNVDISGIVDESLVQSALKDLARDKFDDLDDLIESWRARVAQGTKLCERGIDGMAHWFKVIKEIMIAVDGPMWTRVVEKGGSPFVGKVAELYYTTNFDIMAYFLLRLEKGDRDAIASIQYAHENLQRGEEAEYWGIEHSWKLSPQQHVDKIFVYAKFCRLWGVPTLIPVAVGMIDQLVDLSPSEPVILDEKRKIEAWKRSAGPVDESAFNAAMNGLEL